MAKFTISAGTAQGKTWKATGTNPVTGKKMTIQGGQKGVRVGKNNPDSEKTFDARHEATGMTPKKYINRLRWDNKALVGTSVNIPDRLFGAKTKSATAKKSSSKSASKKSAAKKSASRKTATKKSVAKKATRKSASKKSGAAAKSRTKTAGKKQTRSASWKSR